MRHLGPVVTAAALAAAIFLNPWSGVSVAGAQGGPPEGLHKPLDQILDINVRDGLVYYRSLRAGLGFMTLHFQDQGSVNRLTIDETDPKSGTAEFKACAVNVEPVRPAEPRARRIRVASPKGA